MPSSGSGTGTPITPPTPPSTSAVTAGCSGRYAEAWQYATFWCQAQLLVGAHDAAGVGSPYLQDSTVNFINAGAIANVGQTLYNVTQNSNGLITAVTENTLTATGVVWDNADTYRSAFLSTSQRSQIEHYLNITAGDIHAALGSVAACDCSFSEWGLNYLAEVNIISARVFYDCPCAPDLSDNEKRMYSELITDRLKLIRSGEVDVCDDATGSLFPATSWAEQGVTPFANAEIILNDILRNRTT